MIHGLFQFRATLGARWRRYISIALLLGVLGGIGMFSVAGARRTQSAYPRFLRSIHASTMAVDAGPYDAAFDSAVRKFPEVQKSSSYIAFNVASVVDGKPDLTSNFESLGSLDGRFFDQDRFTPTKGRRPDPTRRNEVAVNEFAARKFGYHVSQRLVLGTYADEQVYDPEFAKNPSPPKLQMTATIVGIGLFAEEVIQDESDASALLLLTPAYTAKAKHLGTYAWQGLTLRRGDADVDAVKKEAISLLPPGSPQFFRVTSVDTFHSLRAIRPLSIALGLFGIIAALAAVVLSGQAISRLFRQEREERTILRALGATPRAIAFSALLGPLLSIVLGVSLALVLAVGASAATPLGRVRKVEVRRGIHLDLTVLGIGTGVLVTFLVAYAVAASWREVSRGTKPSRESPSVVAGAATAAGMPPAAVTGLRMAFEPGSGRTSVSTRSVMGGAAIAITALVASLTFGSSLTALVANHQLYGWNWDATYIDTQGYGNSRLDGAHQVLDTNADVDSWSAAYFGSDLINRRNVPLLGITAGSPVLPPLVHGRAAANPDEVVLGEKTAAQLGKGIGDEISLGAFAPQHTLRIVGTAIMPTLGIVRGAHTSLGVGAIVDPQLVPGFDRNVTETKVFGPNAIFIRFRAGADQTATFARLSRSIEPIASSPGSGVLIGAQRPAEIVNTSELGKAPTLLAGALAVAAVGSLALALTSSVRRRQRDLAVLKVIGFTHRQVGATVAWQATATIAVGLVIGIPSGVIIGRGLWGLFAGELDVVPRSTVPLLILLGLLVSACAVANVVAAVPARLARRIRPSLLLRGE